MPNLSNFTLAKRNKNGPVNKKRVKDRCCFCATFEKNAELVSNNKTFVVRTTLNMGVNLT